MMPDHGWSTEDAPADFRSCRSVSAREERSYGVSSEKRRSTSFDDTIGELANARASFHAEGHASEPIKKKASFWQSRLWKSIKGKKRAIEAQRPEEGLCVAHQAKEEDTVPRWRKLLRKLRSSAKEVRKPAICASGRDLQVANGIKESAGLMNGEGKSKALSNQVERQQKLYTVHPEPIGKGGMKVATLPIWERRNAAQPSNLDLKDLKVTGLKHLQRPH